MNTSKSNINIGVVCIGCLSWFGWRCLTWLALFALDTLLITIPIIHIPQARIVVPFLVFLVGLATDMAVGYLTARLARAKGVAANLHLLVVGSSIMLFRGLILAAHQNSHLPPLPSSAIISWFLFLPLLFFGASFHRSNQQNLTF